MEIGEPGWQTGRQTQREQKPSPPCKAGQTAAILVYVFV